MSYLNVPRIHFGGAFFAGPATANNIKSNYLPGQPIDPQWNPRGVNLFYLQACHILSVVDANSVVIDSSAADPLIGALVETPTPEKPKFSPSGNPYGLAKLVDLDADQQGRSAVYGLRIFVTLPGADAGFFGLMSVPNLRSMSTRIPMRAGSWSNAANLQGSMTDVTWMGDLSQSSHLADFQLACTQGISVNLTIDLHRNDPRFVGTVGDEFCYGRVLGTLGPVLSGEPAQFVAGRWLAPAPQSTWSPVPFIVREDSASNRHFVTIDLGGAIKSEFQPSTTFPNVFTSSGRFVDDSAIQVGMLAPMEALKTPRTAHAVLAQADVDPFVALSNGLLSLTGAYHPIDSVWKKSLCLANAGVVDIELLPAEVARVATSPLQIALPPVDGAQARRTVLEERGNGIYVNWRETSLRLQQPQSGSTTVATQFDALSFGVPITSADFSLDFDILAVEWSLTPQGWRASFVPSNDLKVEIQSRLDAAGDLTRWLIVSASDREITLPEIRRSQDSKVYYIFPTTASTSIGQIGDGDPILSVLLWRKFTAPANPTWTNDVGPILAEYAKLYPGMTDIFDIGQEASYQSADIRAMVKERLSASRDDPAYMPVTRDLADARIAMIIAWLDQHP